MKKIGSKIVIAVLVGVMATTTVFAAPTVNSLKEDKKAAQKEAKNLEKQLTALMTKIDELEADLIKTGAAILEATEDLEAAEVKEKEQYESMKQRIVAMYENGNSSMLNVIFESKSIGEMLRQAENVRIIHEYDRKQLEEYVAVKQKIADLKETLETEMKNIEKKQTSFEKQKKDLDKLLSDKKKEIANYDIKIQQATNASSNYKPPAGAGNGNAIVAAAYKYLNVPYKWGGMSMSGVDCSGLTSLAHKAVGISLSRTSGAQGRGGKPVPNMASALPGDVVCYSGHVGIYIGGGKMIHAPHTGDVVKIANVYGSPWFRRYW